ncbi:hypothetical protein CC80DRAFT_507691 [Byssothecium circinans]|uniref:Uncharacterized protein n=1 Tax=Byssothecium circinans TaxID=147558 RepID=A0A6A5TVI0_9PLEO|nr:hypothetical protein CC80DRAFT_507691 [Byssothecium circinans]
MASPQDLTIGMHDMASLESGFRPRTTDHLYCGCVFDNEPSATATEPAPARETDTRASNEGPQSFRQIAPDPNRLPLPLFQEPHNDHVNPLFPIPPPHFASNTPQASAMGRSDRHTGICITMDEQIAREFGIPLYPRDVLVLKRINGEAVMVDPALGIDGEVNELAVGIRSHISSLEYGIADPLMPGFTEDNFQTAVSNGWPSGIVAPETVIFHTQEAQGWSYDNAGDLLALSGSTNTDNGQPSVGGSLSAPLFSEPPVGLGNLTGGTRSDGVFGDYEHHVIEQQSLAQPLIPSYDLFSGSPLRPDEELLDVEDTGDPGGSNELPTTFSQPLSPISTWVREQTMEEFRRQNAEYRNARLPSSVLQPSPLRESVERDEEMPTQSSESRNPSPCSSTDPLDSTNPNREPDSSASSVSATANTIQAAWEGSVSGEISGTRTYSGTTEVTGAPEEHGFTDALAYAFPDLGTANAFDAVVMNSRDPIEFVQEWDQIMQGLGIPLSNNWGNM